MTRKVIKEEQIKDQLALTVETSRFWGLSKTIDVYMTTNHLYKNKYMVWVKYPTFEKVSLYDDVSEFLQSNLNRLIFDGTITINITKEL